MQTKKLIALLSVVATFDETSARVTDSNETQELRLADSSPATDANHSGEVQLLQMDDTHAMETREERAPPRKAPPIPGLQQTNLLPKKVISKATAIQLPEKVISKAAAIQLAKDAILEPAASNFRIRYEQHFLIKMMDAYRLEGYTFTEVKELMASKFGSSHRKDLFPLLKAHTSVWSKKFAPKITEADGMLQKNTPQKQILEKLTADTSAYTLEEKERLTACIEELIATHDKMRVKFADVCVTGCSDSDILKEMFEGQTILVKKHDRRIKHVQLWLKEWNVMNHNIVWSLQKGTSISKIEDAVKLTHEQLLNGKNERFSTYIHQLSEQYNEMKKKFDSFAISGLNYYGIHAMFRYVSQNIMAQLKTRLHFLVDVWCGEWKVMNDDIDRLLRTGTPPLNIWKAVKPKNELFSSEQDVLLFSYIYKRSDDYHNMNRGNDEAPLVVPPLEISKMAVSDNQVSSMSDLERMKKRLNEQLTMSEAEVTKKLMDWLDKSETEVLERLRAPTSNVPVYLIDHYFQKFKNLRAEMAAYHQKWSQEKLSPSAVSAMENLSNAAKDDPKVRYYDLYKSPGSEIAT